MPTKEQIATSIIEALKSTGVKPRHPVPSQAYEGLVVPELHAKFYLGGVIYQAMNRAKLLAGEYWGDVTVLEDRSHDYNRKQTGVIIQQLDEVVTNGRERGAQNLRKMGITSEVLYKAEESLFEG